MVPTSLMLLLDVFIFMLMCLGFEATDDLVISLPLTRDFSGMHLVGMKAARW